MELQKNETLIGNPLGRVPGKLSWDVNNGQGQLTMKDPCQRPENVPGM